MSNPENLNSEKKKKAGLGAEILKKLGIEQWADANLQPQIKVKRTADDLPEKGLTAGGAMFAALQKGRKHGREVDSSIEKPGKKPFDGEDLGDEWEFRQDHGE